MMTMRGLIWLVLLFAAAAAIALVGVFDGGQVLLIVPPYRVDISLNLFVVAIVLAFIVIYAVLRAVRNVWKMP
jgi:HemY protein